MPENRSIVYVDGFNLYYGALKGSAHKWLDLEALFRKLRNADDIQKIKYFTARVTPPALARQEAYLKALSTRPLIKIIEGRFKLKQVKCEVKPCAYSGSRFFQRPEEKRTDVNIALEIAQDAYENRCDTFIIVSGDSDLVPALDLVKLKFPEKRIVVYVPAMHAVRGAATEIRSVADKDRTFPLSLLQHCQFPASFTDGAGTLIVKPSSW